MTVEADLRTYLLTTSASGVSSNNTFLGPSRKAGNGVPIKAVFIIETPGYQPNEFMDGGLSGTYRFSEAQIRVRGLPNDYLNTRAMADAIWLKFQKPSTASITGRNYVRVFNLQSGPLYAGVNDQECDEFFLNVRCENES